MQSRILMVCVSMGSILLASVASASPNPTSDEVLITQLSSQWMAAVENKDRKSLESILAANYMLQMPGEDQYIRRAEWLKNALTKDWSDFRYENVVVKVYGDHATVSSRLLFKVSPSPFVFDSGVLDIWERRGGSWQVTNRYLGESKLKQRMSFILGALASALALAVGYVVLRLSRRINSRAA